MRALFKKRPSPRTPPQYIGTPVIRVVNGPTHMIIGWRNGGFYAEQDSSMGIAPHTFSVFSPELLDAFGRIRSNAESGFEYELFGHKVKCGTDTTEAITAALYSYFDQAHVYLIEGPSEVSEMLYRMQEQAELRKTSGSESE
jgi:hypothetical protein